MTRKKSKTGEIVGNLDPKYWVQKSDPLVLMRSVPFSLGELKILDTYISRINAADDTRRTVIFTKEEYEELMGLSCVDYRTLQKYTKGLLGKVVELQMPNKDYLQFVLFTKAHYHKDEYGKPIIELTCTEEAKDLFFCIGKYQYFKYALDNVINLTRKASYLLYLYILTNRYRGEWELSLDELRDRVLDCKGQESYQEYKIFKNRVLDPAVKEINKKTDCHFEYEALKHGRRVVKIKFTYLSKNEIVDQLPLIFEQQTEQSQDAQLVTESEADAIDDMDEDEKILSKYGSERLAFLAGACDYEFTKEEMRVIYNTILEIKGSCPDNEKYDYLKHKYDILKNAATRNKISYRFNYFLTIIKNSSGE